MAASLLQKLLKKPFPPPPPLLRVLTSINQPHPPQSLLPREQNPVPKYPNPNPCPSPPPPSSSFPIYPSYPQWFHLNPPISPFVSDPSYVGADPDGSEPTATVWADSVKKKRKKKMNKHKYRKLRKRLRRQT